MDLSQLSNETTKIAGLSSLIVVSPQQVIGYQPQNPPGSTASLPEALLFHYEAENTVNLESDITDHYTEDNSAINDHIALRPETVTVRGFIGELNDVVPKALQPLKTIADKLSVMGAFTPGLSESALRAYNEAWFLYNTGASAVNSLVSVYSSISNAVTGSTGQNVISQDGVDITKNQTKQQKAFTQFYGYWRNRTLFQVQTPWAVFENMAIKSLRALQDSETAVITDFEITFKMMRYANTVTKKTTQGRLQSQGSSLVNLGTSAPSPVADNFLDKVSGIA